MPGLLDLLDVVTTRYDPVDAEVTFSLPLDQPLEGAELRGRLHGPRCPYTETIEIAYPLKPIQGEAGLLRSRVVIPEASLWEPSTPFLYQGQVELWHGGRMLESVRVAHGLRQLILRKEKLLLNGRRFPLRGLKCAGLSTDEAHLWREASLNVLLVQARTDNALVWEEAERLGFFVLGELDGADDDVLWRVEAEHSRRTSCLGWLLPQHLTRHPQLWHNAMSLLHGQGRRHLIGVRVEEPPLGVLPGHVGFVACERRHLDALMDLQVPRVALLRRAGQSDDLMEQAGAQPPLGWFAQSLE